MMTQINGDTDLKLCEKFPLLINKKAYLLGESLLKNNLIYNEFLEKKKRESFLNFNIIKLSYISKTHDIIDPYSSSDEEIEDGIKFKTHPGVKDVCEVIVDVNTLMIIDDAKDFPIGVRHGLLFENIDSWWDKSRLFKFLSKIPLEGLNAKKLNRYIGEIIIYKQSLKTFAFVKFYSKLICELVFNFLNNKTKQKFYPLRNSEQEAINVMFSYDLTDMKNSLWYAIVLRNFPTNLQAMQITQFCKNFYPGVLYALPTKEIYNQNCAVVVLNDCEEAESLCSQLNNKEYCTGYTLKAHMHPKSSKFRKNLNKSHFKFILDANKMKQLGNINFLQKKNKPLDTLSVNSNKSFSSDFNEDNNKNRNKNSSRCSSKLYGDSNEIKLESSGIKAKNNSLQNSSKSLIKIQQTNNSSIYNPNELNFNQKPQIRNKNQIQNSISNFNNKLTSINPNSNIISNINNNNINNSINNNSNNNNNLNNQSNKKQKKEFLPYGVANIDDHLEIFKKFHEQTLKVFVNNEADFSPLRPSSPNAAYDKVLNSPRRQINSIVNSPNYVPYSPHRINSPIRSFSQYDDADFEMENNFSFSPIRKIKEAENASVFSQSPTARSMLDCGNAKKDGCFNLANFSFGKSDGIVKNEFINGFD